MAATRAAYVAFREEYVSSDALYRDALYGADFAGFDARRLRYSILWAFYENTAYRNVHRWAKTYRTQYGLYRYIRNIYNPAYRLGEFWKMMLWGGSLKVDDNGATDKGAIPIETKNDALRPPIAKLWQDSNWPVNKDICTLWGSVMGDVGIKIIDNPIKQLMRLEIIHPGMIKDLDIDGPGFVKSYTLEYERELDGKPAIYTESAGRDGDDVIYETLKDGKPFAWPENDIGQGPQQKWAIQYGFIPFVSIQHNNVGLDWGWSELHPERSKVHEIDDLASKLDDQIRKLEEPGWLFAGVSKPTGSPTPGGASATTDRPDPGREEIPALYSPSPDAKAIPLVAPMQIADVNATIGGILKELERDYPELQMDIWTAAGDSSGKALRIARQRAEAKVIDRRPNYDSALVRAQQMAIAIGGFRQYPGYEGFGLDSYAAGALDHSIAEHAVFAKDPLDDAEIVAAEMAAVKAGVDAGLSPEFVLRQLGKSQEEIDQVFADTIPPVGQ